MRRSNNETLTHWARVEGVDLAMITSDLPQGERNTHRIPRSLRTVGAAVIVLSAFLSGCSEGPSPKQIRAQGQAAIDYAEAGRIQEGTRAEKVENDDRERQLAATAETRAQEAEAREEMTTYAVAFALLLGGAAAGGYAYHRNRQAQFTRERTKNELRRQQDEIEKAKLAPMVTRLANDFALVTTPQYPSVQIIVDTRIPGGAVAVVDLEKKMATSPLQLESRDLRQIAAAYFTAKMLEQTVPLVMAGDMLRARQLIMPALQRMREDHAGEKGFNMPKIVEAAEALLLAHAHGETGKSLVTQSGADLGEIIPPPRRVNAS